MARRRKRWGAWLTGIEAAQYLGVDPKTIYHWQRDGLIERETAPGYAQPRFSKANLDELKKRAERQGVPLLHHLIRAHRDNQGVPDRRRREFSTA